MKSNSPFFKTNGALQHYETLQQMAKLKSEINQKAYVLKNEGTTLNIKIDISQVSMLKMPLTQRK